MRERFISSFSSHPEVLGFVRYLCSPDENGISADLATFSLQVLYECLIQDKLEMVSVYIRTFHDIHKFQGKKGESVVFTHTDATSLRAMLDYSFKLQERREKSVMDPSYVNMFRHELNEYWKSVMEQNQSWWVPTMQMYCQRGKWNEDLSMDQYRIFVGYMAFMSWPTTEEAVQMFKMGVSSKPSAPFLIKQAFPHIPIQTIRLCIKYIQENK
jgi:hypothetical protein